MLQRCATSLLEAMNGQTDGRQSLTHPLQHFGISAITAVYQLLTAIPFLHSNMIGKSGQVNCVGLVAARTRLYLFTCTFDDIHTARAEAASMVCTASRTAVDQALRF